MVMTLTIPTIPAAVARIRAFAIQQGWRPARFAREAGLSPNALRDFDGPDWSPNVATLLALEAIIPADFTHVESTASPHDDETRNDVPGEVAA